MEKEGGREDKDRSGEGLKRGHGKEEELLVQKRKRQTDRKTENVQS